MELASVGKGAWSTLTDQQKAELKVMINLVMASDVYTKSSEKLKESLQTMMLYGVMTQEEYDSVYDNWPME